MECAGNSSVPYVLATPVASSRNSLNSQVLKANSTAAEPGYHLTLVHTCGNCVTSNWVICCVFSTVTILKRCYLSCTAPASPFLSESARAFGLRCLFQKFYASCLAIRNKLLSVNHVFDVRVCHNGDAFADAVGSYIY